METELERVWPLDKFHYLTLPSVETEELMNEPVPPRAVEAPAPRRRRPRRDAPKKPAPVPSSKPRAARAPDQRVRLKTEDLEHLDRLHRRIVARTRIAGVLIKTNGQAPADLAEMIGELLEEIGDAAREMYAMTTPKEAL